MGGRLAKYASTFCILEDCPSTMDNRNWEKIVDDVITWSDRLEGAFHRICSLLSHCIKNGLVFSPEKFKFARREVEFTGFLITENRIKPAAKYTAAIRDFLTPSNISEVRSCYAHLLSPNTPFEWTDELEEAFTASKEKIIESIQKGVYSFDPRLETCLSTDYSKEGMGWILQQKTCDCQRISPTCCPDRWRVVLAGVGWWCLLQAWCKEL